MVYCKRKLISFLAKSFIKPFLVVFTISFFVGNPVASEFEICKLGYL